MGSLTWARVEALWVVQGPNPSGWNLTLATGTSKSGKVMSVACHLQKLLASVSSTSMAFLSTSQTRITRSCKGIQLCFKNQTRQREE